MRVLIVDGYRDAADSLADLLALFGHDARVCYAGDEAEAAAVAFDPAAVVVDLILPRLGGAAVAVAIRAALPGAALVALTGLGRPEDRAASAAAGFGAHLLKPCGLGEVLVAIGADPAGTRIPGAGSSSPPLKPAAVGASPSARPRRRTRARA